jgi:PAP2 superfamily
MAAPLWHRRSSYGVHALALGSLLWQGFLWLFISWQLQRVSITPVIESGKWLYLTLLAGVWLVGVLMRLPRLSDAVVAIAVMVLFSIPGLFGQYAALSLNLPWADPWLAHLDESLGIHIPTVVQWVTGHPTVYNALLIGYASFLWQVGWTPFLIAVFSRERLWTYVVAYQAAWSLALLGIALLPAEHAFVHYNYPIDMHMIGAEMVADIHRARMHMPWTLSIGATNGLVSFPSFHAAVGVLMVWTMRGRNALSALVLLTNVLLILGTAFLGSHYVIDVIASLLMMPAILWAAQRLTHTAFRETAAPSVAPRPHIQRATA